MNRAFGTAWRFTRVALPIVIAAGTLGGCGNAEDQLEEVKTAIATTRRSAGNFVYQEQRGDTKIDVAGALEDDFRFKALVSYNGQPGYEEVVADDVLAMRFHDPERIANQVDPSRIGNADLSTELEGVTAVQALQSRRWVLDEAGAPPITSLGFIAEDVGKDPVFDAVTALDYVEAAMGEAFRVERWSEDALNPTYPSSEDFFPKPDDGSGVERYDLNRPFLPPAAAGGAGSGGDRALPTTKNFRKLAIYVKDRRVIRILERTEVVGKMVATLGDYLNVFVREASLPQELVDRFQRIRTATIDEKERGSLYLEFLNRILVGLGEDPILARTMSLEVTQGQAAVSVALPTTDVVKGSLEIMLASRRSKGAAETTGGADEAPLPGDQLLPTETTLIPGETPTSSVEGEGEVPVEPVEPGPAP